MNTIEAAAGHVGTAFDNGYAVPFVMYEVQGHFGWTDDQMKDAGYVRGLGGWRYDPEAPQGPASTGIGSGGRGGGGVSIELPSFSGGGSKNSFAGSSLINWRI
jgi:hypothetical protein